VTVPAVPTHAFTSPSNSPASVSSAPRRAQPPRRAARPGGCAERLFARANRRFVRGSQTEMWGGRALLARRCRRAGRGADRRAGAGRGTRPAHVARSVPGTALEDRARLIHWAVTQFINSLTTNSAPTGTAQPARACAAARVRGAAWAGAGLGLVLRRRLSRAAAQVARGQVRAQEFAQRHRFLAPTRELAASLDAPDLDRHRAVPCHAPEVSEVCPARARAPRVSEVLQHHRGVSLEVLLLEDRRGEPAASRDRRRGRDRGRVCGEFFCDDPALSCAARGHVIQTDRPS